MVLFVERINQYVYTGLLVCFLSISIYSAGTMSEQMVGGPSEAKPADESVQELINSVREKAEEKANKKFDEYTAISYKSQVVAGTNFFVKVKIGSDAYVHLRVFKPLPHTGESASLSDIQTDKSADDEIAYF